MFRNFLQSYTRYRTYRYISKDICDGNALGSSVKCYGNTKITVSQYFKLQIFL
jgi:hypothetical protein